MVWVLVSVFAVSLIAAVLAAVVVAAERVLRNYGPCEIEVNGSRTFTVQGGGSLLAALGSDGIFIPSACGGRGTCGYCKVKVLEGGGPIAPVEEPYLEPAERKMGVRLSCQVRVRNALRIVIPPELLAIREYACPCTRIRDLTHDIREFRLELPAAADFAYRPGQYVQLLAPAYGGNDDVYRAYSIASDPAAGNVIELVIRLVPGGICSTWCFEQLREGQTVQINGPYGQFGLTDSSAPMIFVAGGSGMAPMRCLLHHLKNTASPRPVTFFFGANFVKELFYLDDMAAFEKALPQFRFVPVVAHPDADERWEGETGLVTQALERQFHDASGHEGYLCGSPGMIDAAVAVLRKLGIPENRIFFDKF